MEDESQTYQPGTFEIVIDNIAPVPVRQIADILIALDAAFRQYSGRHTSGRHRVGLGATGFQHGSIQILLDALEQVDRLWEARELFAPFVSHMMEVTRILLGLRSGKVTQAEKKVIQAISQPVASGTARQINLINNGTIYLNIDSATAGDLLHASNTAAKQVTEFLPNEPHLPLTRKEIQALETGGADGTALLVDGEWYARLIGGQGVLVPAKVKEHVSAALVHQGMYRFHGSVIRGSHGEAVGIEVTGARRLDG